MKQTERLFDPEKAARDVVRERGGLLPKDVARELLAPPGWIEENRFRLPKQLLDLYATDAQRYGCTVFCTDCPDPPDLGTGARMGSRT